MSDDPPVKMQSAELQLVQTILKNDLTVAQRGDLVAQVGAGTVWMLEFQSLLTSDDFHHVAVELTTRWRRPTTEVRNEIDQQLDVDRHDEGEG